MKLFYFVHLTGRDHGNSGVQRVVRNLGTALHERADVELLPVRWCRERRAIVHAEQHFLATLGLFSGPRVLAHANAGQPIDRDADPAKGDWLLVPEVPHLSSHDDQYPPVHLSYLTGYIRQHHFRVAAIFHDILPLSHLGREDQDDIETLKFVSYANALAFVDRVMPVSQASAKALQDWLLRNGIAQSRWPAIEAILLPEEMVGVEKHNYLATRPSRGAVELVMWGSIHRHKNQLGVMQAFNAMCESRPTLDVHLHVYGHVMGELAAQISLAVRRSQGRIKLHGFVADGVLHEAIGKARASVFLSLAEGYGLPVAESLWLGKPCLTSDRAPMTEIAARGGCLLADPESELDMAAALELIASSDEALAKLQSEIESREMRTWAGYAANISEALAATPLESGTPVIEIEPTRLRDYYVRQCEILPQDLKYHDLYADGDYALLTEGRIRYTREQHAFADVPDLFYGPYIDLPKGRYRLKFLGQIEGSAELRITREFGGDLLNRRTISDDFEFVHFDLDCHSRFIEFIISRLPKTRFVEIERIVVERLL